MPDLDPQAKLFLQFIKGFTAENIRDGITKDIDLGQLVLEEYDESVLTEFRHYARLYDVTHPGKKAALSDLNVSAQKVLEWLKVQRPDLGFEIATYETYRTVGALGLSVEGETMPYVIQSEHVGIAWLKKNIQSLASVLL